MLDWPGLTYDDSAWAKLGEFPAGPAEKRGYQVVTTTGVSKVILSEIAKAFHFCVYV